MHRCGSNLGVTELGQIAIVTEAYKLYRKNYIRELIAAMKDLNKRELNKKNINREVVNNVLSPNRT